MRLQRWENRGGRIFPFGGRSTVEVRLYSASIRKEAFRGYRTHIRDPH
jgi:hypothetical protein